MDLMKKFHELKTMSAALDAEATNADQQTAAWQAKRQEIEKSRLVLSGRMGQLEELLAEQSPADVEPTSLAAVPDVAPEATSPTI